MRRSRIKMNTRKQVIVAVGVVLALLGSAGALLARRKALRQPNEDIRSADMREMSGLLPNEHLLFNGWGVTPAGEHVPISDMPLKLVVAPDGRTLAAVS